MRISKTTDLFFWVAGLLLISFVLIKSSLLDLTHDEAYSFHNIKDFWYAEFLCTGNSHWLNSAAMKMAVSVNLESPAALRWFSSLSFIIFVFSGIKWVQRQERLSVQLCSFCLLFLSPYMLDFFSLARGYAGGLQFELSSLLLLDLALKSKRRAHFFASLACAALSAISNFSFVYFFFAFSLIYFTRVHLSSGTVFLKKAAFWTDLFFSLATGTVIARAFLFMIRCSNDVVGAGDDSLFRSFDIFYQGLVYEKFQPGFTTTQIISAILLVCLIAAAVYGILFIRHHKNIFYQLSSSVFLLMILTMIINFYAFRVVFPYSRSSLLFFPFLAMLLTGLLSSIRIKEKLTGTALYIISLLLIANFFFSLNLKSVMEYKQQSNSSLCFDVLEKIKADRVGISPELFGVYINYYQMTEKRRYTFRGESFYPSANSSAEAYDYLLLTWPWFEKGFSLGRRKAEVVWANAETKHIIIRLYQN